jgi:2',3'-cyclic-nucleotide 2'-phosphodiesterase (5'-nucleotidase family)
MSKRVLPLPLLFSCALVPFAAACGDDDPVDGGLPGSDVGFADSGVDGGNPTDTGVDGGNPADGGNDGGTDAGDTGPGDAGSKSIIFLHTNDEHSQHLGFAPNLDDWPTLSTDPTIKGGIYRRAAVLENLKLEASQPPLGSPVALVGAGDIMMGSLFHLGNLFASPDYNIVDTVLQYNVLTFGNHEFDFGAARLATAIGQGHLDPLTVTFSALQTPVVVSNIRFSMSASGDDTLAAFYSEMGGPGRPIRRTHVQRFGNVNVGFVGVMGLDAALVAPFKSPVTFSLAVDETSSCTNDSGCPGSICIPPADDAVATTGKCALDPTGQDAAINFPAMVADVASAVAELRGRNVDLVVCVSHAGVNERELATLAAMGMGPEDATASEEIILTKAVNAALAANGGLKGIDLVIGGHSHTALDAPLTIPNADGSNSYIVQAGSNGRFIGKVRLTQEGGGAWTLDTNYSGLEPVDGSVDASGLNFITQMVIDGLLNQLIDGLEGRGIAAAGDNLIFPGEQCDGAELPNDGNCLDLVPGASGGTLSCHANRQLDFSACTLVTIDSTCGDNTVAGAEQCDGTTLPLTCGDLGYDGGTLSCAGNCTYNTSACTPHFQSLLEIVLNFDRPEPAPILHTPATPQGDLFFYTLGTTEFDVGETISSNESNLTNLVADANRAIANKLSTSVAATGNPIQVSIVANGVVRDGLYEGQTGNLSLADLFRVMPLGVSPIENTPGYPLTDFYLLPAELKLAFEIGLSAGFRSDSFWLGFSGARVEYDLSRPTLDKVTSIHLLESDPKASPSAEYEDINGNYEGTPLYTLGNFRSTDELIHVSSDLYITLFATGFGICPRNATGAPFPHCAPCTQPSECTVPGSTCDTTANVCKGGNPVAFSVRTFAPTAAVGIAQELKEFLALTSYVRNLPGNGSLPTNYSEATPRRLCCVGTMCPADGSRDCPPLPN